MLRAAALVGRHRLQARYPARSASVAVPKNSTRARVGRREAHEGRQKIRVELTAYTNLPSNARSRCWTARQAVARSGRARVTMDQSYGSRSARLSEPCGQTS